MSPLPAQVSWSFKILEEQVLQMQIQLIFLWRCGFGGNNPSLSSTICNIYKTFLQKGLEAWEQLPQWA